MQNMNGEQICGEIWTKDFMVNDHGVSGLSQRTETCYCTKKPRHSGAHAATMEGGPDHGKLIKAWVSS